METIFIAKLPYNVANYFWKRRSNFWACFTLTDLMTKPLKSRKNINNVFCDFSANFGVLYLRILLISTNIPAAAVLIVQKQYTGEIITSLNQKC